MGGWNRWDRWNRHNLQEGGAVAPSLVTDGLIAEYRFDDGSGQVLTDYGGNGYHMQLGSTSGADTNDPTWSAEGLTFTTDDYTVIDQSALRSDAWTVFVVGSETAADVGYAPFLGWHTANTGPGLFSHYAGFGNDNPTIYGNLAGADDYQRFDSVAPVNDGVYRCYSFACAGVTASDITSSKMWLNGSGLIQADGQADSNFNTKVLTYIGQASAKYLIGKVAYVIYYNRVLTDAEILQVYAYLQAAVAGRGIVLP